MIEQGQIGSVWHCGHMWRHGGLRGNEWESDWNIVALGRNLRIFGVPVVSESILVAIWSNRIEICLNMVGLCQNHWCTGGTDRSC